MKTKKTETKLTVQQAAEKVIYALKKSGFKREEAQEIFKGLYHGEAWNEFDLSASIYVAYLVQEAR